MQRGVIKLRIWSKRLIPVLPTKQLRAMRYELGNMIKQYPKINHSLVKFANDYDIAYLGEYFKEVILQLKERTIMLERYNTKIENIVFNKTKMPLESNLYTGETNWDYLQFKEDNDEYLKICYWNLYEKHIRGIISDEEWMPIERLFKME